MSVGNATGTHKHSKSARKQAVVQSHIRGDTLHIGFAGETFETATAVRAADGWCHRWVAEAADRCLGIDIDEQSVLAAQEAGYDAKLANAQDFALAGQFDTIVATNVIEHLSRPGAMLECARDHLRPGGRLLLTTPRTHIPWNLAEELKSGITTADEHCMWYCRDTLETILDRTGFNVDYYESWGYRKTTTHWSHKAFETLTRGVESLPGIDGVTDYQHFLIATPKDNR